jgi:hypothetical protein
VASYASACARYKWDALLMLMKLGVLLVCASRSGHFVYQAF